MTTQTPEHQEDLIPLKKCVTCKKEFPRSLDYFYRSVSGRFGLHTQCKPCYRHHKNKIAMQNMAFKKAKEPKPTPQMIVKAIPSAPRKSLEAITLKPAKLTYKRYTYKGVDLVLCSNKQDYLMHTYSYQAFRKLHPRKQIESIIIEPDDIHSNASR